MKTVPLYFPFCLALFVALFGAAFLPSLHLSTFSPFLALVFYRRSFASALWISFGCGVILDLLNSEARFGLYAFNLVVTTLFLYHQKKQFFEDKAIAFSLFTMAISAVSVMIQIFLLHALDRGITLSLHRIFTSAVLMSVCDGVYAFLWFTCPMKFYIYIKKVGWKTLFTRKNAHDPGREDGGQKNQ